jgi:long-chain-fatty-acid--CoA ligase ACSBG
MGFNTPEWAIAFTGSIMHNNVVTGIYSTNAPDACIYQSEHAECEVIMVETNEMLQRFMKFGKDPIKRVKAFVVYGEKSLPSENQDNRVYLWKDFLKLGKNVPNDVILEKCLRQKAGECAVLIYTSGTTGKPKGCMISHDNLTWGIIEVMEVASQERPELVGPQNRTVSYLPLSHIAGLLFDIMGHYFNASELYFAKPDALSGSLVQTLQWARPTLFLAVPRVWEKFEEKLKEIASTKPKILQSLSGWAKQYGTLNTHAKQVKENPPFMYSVANFIVLNTVKKALGLDQC